jgi:hypothetical protein
MSNSGLTLQALFLSAKQKQEQLSHGDPRSVVYQELQHGLMQELMECRNLVTRTSMFSVNEDIEDISTHDIPYGLIEGIETLLTLLGILQSTTYWQTCC